MEVHHRSNHFRVPVVTLVHLHQDILHHHQVIQVHRHQVHTLDNRDLIHRHSSHTEAHMTRPHNQVKQLPFLITLVRFS